MNHLPYPEAGETPLRIQPHAGHAFFIFVIVLGVFLALNIVLGYFPASGRLYLVDFFIIELGAILLPVIIFISLKRLDFKTTLKINPLPFYSCILVVLVTVTGIIILGEIEEILRPLSEPFQDVIFRSNEQLMIASQENIILFLIGVTFMPAICEEFLFRGILFSGLENNAGKTRAIILSALLFGLVHFIPSRIVLITLLGVLLGVMVVLTRSILAPIIAHFINNVIAIFGLFQGEFWMETKESWTYPLILVFASIIFLSGLILMGRFSHRNKSPGEGG